MWKQILDTSFFVPVKPMTASQRFKTNMRGQKYRNPVATKHIEFIAETAAQHFMKNSIVIPEETIFYLELHVIHKAPVKGYSPDKPNFTGDCDNYVKMVSDGIQYQKIEPKFWHPLIWDDKYIVGERIVKLYSKVFEGYKIRLVGYYLT